MYRPVTLRPWLADDAAVMVSLFDDSEVNRWTPLPSPFTHQHAIKRIDGSRRALSSSQLRILAVVAGSAVVGEVSAFPAGGDRDCAEVAYVVGTAFRGRGFAVGGLRLLLTELRRQWKPPKFVAMISPDNPSLR